MNEETAIWKIVAATIVGITLSISGCESFRTAKIADMVSAGADPLKAHCAVVGLGNSNAAVCAVLAAKESLK